MLAFSNAIISREHCDPVSECVQVEKDELARREAEQTTTEWAGVPPVEGGFGTTEPAAAATAGEVCVLCVHSWT